MPGLGGIGRRSRAVASGLPSGRLSACPKRWPGAAYRPPALGVGEGRSEGCMMDRQSDCQRADTAA